MYIVGRFPFNQNVWFEFLAEAKGTEHFPKFPKKRKTSRVIPKFSKMFPRKFSFHSTLLPEFPEFSVEWFSFRKFNTFQNFWNLFREISAPFSKFSKVLGEYGKCPMWNGNLLCLSHSSASLPLQHGCFVPRERLAVKGLFRAIQARFFEKKKSGFNTNSVFKLVKSELFYPEN